MMDSTLRFSDRVENYVKYRPTYPQEVLETLSVNYGLTKNSVIADIGSGTGILTKLFINNDNPVFSVEPNKEMREAAESLFEKTPHFNSIAATAEKTELPSGSTDLIVVGQAFHWFDHSKSKQEFLRILRSGGYTILIWNEWQSDSNLFLKAYESLLEKYVPDYANVKHSNVGKDVIKNFYNPGSFKIFNHTHHQQFDFEGLKGRLMSSSYVPSEEHLEHKPLMIELEKIFNEHQINGNITFEYKTVIHCGALEK